MDWSECDFPHGKESYTGNCVIRSDLSMGLLILADAVNYIHGVELQGYYGRRAQGQPDMLCCFISSRFSPGHGTTSLLHYLRELLQALNRLLHWSAAQTASLNKNIRAMPKLGKFQLRPRPIREGEKNDKKYEVSASRTAGTCGLV